MRHDPTFWLLARASGLTAYVLLTLSVLVGLVVKSRPFRALKPAAVTDLHRILALLGLGALAGHAVALVLDTTVKVSIPALFVPGLISYRPVWTSLGVLAAELMVVVYASFSMRKRIGPKNWRRLHWATYAIFGAATVHGIAAGTDTSRPWAFALYVLAAGSVAAAATWRFLVPPTPARARRAGATRHRRAPATLEPGRSSVAATDASAPASAITNTARKPARPIPPSSRRARAIDPAKLPT